MKYLALDQALRTTGWAFFIDDKLDKWSYYTNASNDDIGPRLGNLWKQLTTWYHDFEFDILFLEDIQQQHGNVATYKKLAYVQAAIILWCYFNDIPYYVLAPSEWRRVLKDRFGQGFGRTRTENKANAKALAQQLYDIDVTEDTADAICLGIAGIEKYGRKKSVF